MEVVTTVVIDLIISPLQRVGSRPEAMRPQAPIRASWSAIVAVRSVLVVSRSARFSHGFVPGWHDP